MPRKKKEPKKLKQEFIKAIEAREYLIDNGLAPRVMSSVGVSQPRRR